MTAAVQFERFLGNSGIVQDVAWMKKGQCRAHAEALQAVPQGSRRRPGKRSQSLLMSGILDSKFPRQ